jgi:anti-sigma-K factor RskA
MPPPAEHEIRELTGLFALGVLGEDERQQVGTAAARSPDVAAEIESFRRAADLLAAAGPRVSPGPYIRARIMAVVAPGARIVALPGRRDASAGAAPRAASARLPWMAAAASLAAAAASGWYALDLRARVEELELALRAAQTRAAGAETQLAAASVAADEGRRTAAVLAAPDVARVDLTGAPAAPLARGRAFWSRSRGLVFTASNLPPLPRGRVYQLWVVTATAPVSAALLTPDVEGRVSVVVATPQDLPPPVAMAVTLEPEGGMPGPTGAQYLLGAPVAGI